MKISIGLLLTCVIGLTSCSNQQTSIIKISSTVDIKADAKKLNDLLTKYEEPSQIFKVPTSKASQVKGKQGTIISINPNDLTTESGEPLGNNIEIELKELINQSQLLNTNAQTISNGQLLVSGGAYYINMTSDGKQLKLKEEKTMDVEFPKITDNEMFLFYGKRDSLGTIEWKQASETFKSKQSQPAQQQAVTKSKTRKQSGMETLLGYIADSTAAMPMTKEEKEKIQRINKVYEKVYSAVKLDSFGWINCDRFLEIQNKTDLFVNFNPSDSINSANIYLVFQDINSVMQTYYSTHNGTTRNNGFKNIPVGYKVRLVAYSIKDEKVLSFASDIVVKDKQIMTLALKETSDDELKKILNN